VTAVGTDGIYIYIYSFPQILPIMLGLCPIMPSTPNIFPMALDGGGGGGMDSPEPPPSKNRRTHRAWQ